MLQRILHSILFLLFLTPLTAQVTFSVVDTTACGNTISVGIAVSNFEEMTAFSYTMTWDEAKLDYLSVSDFNLEYLNGGSFGDDSTQVGKLYTSWTDTDFTGKTLTDGTVIYYVNFTVLGNVGETTTLDIINGDTPLITATGFPPSTVPNATESGTVAFGDFVAPTISCPGDITVQSSSGNPIVINSDLSPIVMDNCDSNPTVTYTSDATPPNNGNDDATGETFPIGTTTVTYIATDAIPLSASCTFVVTVENNNNTVFTFSASDAIVGCAGDPVQIDISGENFIDMTTLSFTFMWDPAVVTLESVGNFNLQHLDNGDFNLNDAANGKFSFSWVDEDFTGEDLSDGETIFSVFFTPIGAAGTSTNLMFLDDPTDLVAAHDFPPVEYPIGINEGSVAINTYNADLNGNATICSGESTNLSVTIAGGDTPYTIVYNDGNADITLIDYENNDPISVTPLTTTTYTLVSISDDNGCDGAIGTTTATVTINQSPTDGIILGSTDTCPGDTTELTISFTGGTAPFIINYTENFGGTSNNIDLTIFQNDTILTVAPTTLTGYTLNSVTDANNCTFIPNGSIAAIIDARDTVSPMITNCPTDAITQNVDANACGAIVTFPSPIATDNCDDAPAILLQTAINSGEEFPVGENTVTFIAQDASGNTSTSCDITIIIIDNEPPQAVNCTPFLPMVSADAGECSAIVVFDKPYGTDNCMVVDSTASHVSGDALPVGQTSLVFTFEDASGLSASCTTTVIVTDDEAPTITCPSDITMAASTTDCLAIVNWTAPIPMDNCPGATAMNTSTFASGDAFPFGVTTITYNAMDAAGNMATACEFNITVFDETEPVFTTCPTNQDVVAATGETTAIVNNIGAVASDNCGIDTLYYVLTDATTGEGANDASGSTFNLGETTVTYTTEDINDLIATCIFTVTVTNEDELMLTCPDNIVENSALDSCGLTVFDIAPMVMPLSELDTVVYELNGATMQIGGIDASGVFYNVGTTDVVYIAVDNDGTEFNCSFTVTINDIIAPEFTFCPSDTTNIPNDAGECGAIFEYATLTATDDCSTIDNITCSTISGSFFPIGTTTVTCTATDEAGNSAIDCVFNVTIIDTENPTISCPNSQTVGVDMTGTSAVVNNIAPVVTDNCAIDTTFYNLTGATIGEGENDASGSTFNLGETTITYTTIDNSDSTATCSFTITVIDNSGLMLTCPDNQMVISPADTCGAMVENIAATVTPTSELDTITYELTGATIGTGGNDASGLFYNIGNTTVIYTATDNDGNMLNCSFTVMVSDTTMPVIANCPTDIAINVAANSCSNTATWIEPTATDNCPNLNMTSNPNSGDEFIVGNTVVNYLAADASGNQATCSFTVTVTDNILPTIADCPEDMEVFAAQGECSATATWTEPTISDNCPNATLSSNHDSGDNFNFGETPVIYIGSDANGNQITCSFIITLTDNEAPVISDCPENITVPATGADCTATVTWAEPTVTDNCPNVSLSGSPVSGTIFQTGTTTVNYLATDASGNTAECSFTVTVQDTENPTVTFCPPNMIANANQNQCSAIITWSEPIFADNCGITSVVSNHDSGETFSVNGPITVIYTASDASGNIATCQFTVEVIDNQPPVIFPMPADIVIGNAPGACSAVVNYVAPQANDNCGVVTFEPTHPSGSEFPVGTTTVTYTAADMAGNITIESFTITVEDNEPPKPVCPETVEITVDGTNLNDPSDNVIGFNPVDCDSIFIELTEPTVTDNCQMASFEQTAGNEFTNGTPFPVGTTLMEYTAMDASGNESICAFNVIVNAIEFPAINVSSIFPCEGDDFIAQVGAYPNAIFNWLNENGDLINTGSSYSISNIASTQAGFYTLEMVLPTCTMSQQFQLTVFETPEIEASANDILCSDGGQDLNLMATIQNGVVVDSWQWEFEGTVISMEQNPTIEAATGDDSGEYIVRAISNNGCFDADTIMVNISTVMQMPSLSADQETTCVGMTINLIGQSYAGNTVEYIWSADPMAGSGLVVVNNFTTTATPTAAGTYTYFFSAIVDGCQTETAQTTVVVEAPPVLNLEIIGNVTCVDGTTPMTLQTDFTNPNATYLWTFNNDSISNEENVTVENISIDNSGSYKLVITLPNGCESEAVVDITITENPAMPDAIVGDDAVCLGEAVTLTGTNYGMDATYNWLLNGVPIPNANNSVVTFFPAETGNNIVTYSATRNGCNSGTVFFNLTVETSPTADLQFIGETTCVNGDAPITLFSNSGDAATSFWLNEANIQVASTPDFTIENVSSDDAGFYYFVAESAIGCQNIDTLNVQITDGLPQIEATLIGEPCEDGNLRLSSSEIQNAAYAWTSPTGNGFSSAQNPLTILASPEFNGMYTVTATTTDGCSTTGNVEVEILTAPTAIDDEIVVIADTNTEFNVLINDGIDTDQAVTVTVLQSTTQGILIDRGNGTFSYQPKEGSLETDMFAYQICYDACPNTCDIAFVELDVQFPKDNCIATTVITPNDDGINDRFVVFCLDVQDLPENELIIYGSWGDEVFRMTGYDNSWKGTYENEPLPDGTYYYIFKRDPNAEPEKGFVMIYR